MTSGSDSIRPLAIEHLQPLIYFNLSIFLASPFYFLLKMSSGVALTKGLFKLYQKRGDLIFVFHVIPTCDISQLL